MIDPNRFNLAMGRAEERLQSSVISIVQDAEERAKSKNPDAHTFGIKNTSAISRELIMKLAASPDFLPLTIDKMAAWGRSIDTELTNPITYRPMTGSTSGGPLNILFGINDVCIGTDGGGSVLAPALATNLFSVIGTGLGLTAGQGVSTDGLKFTGGIGIIGRYLEETLEAMSILCGIDLSVSKAEAESGSAEISVITPAEGCMELPGGEDGHKVLFDYLKRLEPAKRPITADFAFSDIYNREKTVVELKKLMEENPERLFLSFEGPIDVFSADETIPRAFEGPAPASAAGVRGKGLVKAANICGCTAFTVPGGRLASGFVIVCPPGPKPVQKGVLLASRLAEVSKRPEMFEKYFLRRDKECRPLY